MKPCIIGNMEFSVSFSLSGSLYFSIYKQYYVLRKARDDEANQTYLKMLEEKSDGLYIQNIMRGGVCNDDPRIPRNVSK